MKMNVDKRQTKAKHKHTLLITQLLGQHQTSAFLWIYALDILTSISEWNVTIASRAMCRISRSQLFCDKSTYLHGTLICALRSPKELSILNRIIIFAALRKNPWKIYVRPSGILFVPIMLQIQVIVWLYLVRVFE